MSLLILLCACMSGKFCIENPHSSLIFSFHLFRQAVRMLKTCGQKAGLRHPSKSSDLQVGKSSKQHAPVCPSFYPQSDGFGQVYRISMWMQDFKHPTPKPTLLVGNTMGLGQLQPPRGQKRGKKTAAFPTAVKYTNKAGKSCWKGSSRLKSTQILGQRNIGVICFTSFPGSLFNEFISWFPICRHVTN